MRTECEMSLNGTPLGSELEHSLIAASKAYSGQLATAKIQSAAQFDAVNVVGAAILKAWGRSTLKLGLGLSCVSGGETTIGLAAVRKFQKFGSTKAIDWVNEILRDRAIEVRIFAGVLGVSAPPEGVVLGPQIGLLGKAFAGFHRSEVPRSMGHAPRPGSGDLSGASVFLVGGATQSPALTDGSVDPDMKSVMDLHNVLRSLGNLLAAFGPGPTSIDVMWDEAADEDIEWCRFSGGHGSPLNDLVAVGPMPLHMIPANAADAVVPFLAAQGDLRRKLELAFERLNHATKRMHPRDRALEATIALEALLGDENTELTFRYSLRAARLLSSEFSGRMEVRQAIRDLYKLRSKAVHGALVAHDVQTKKVADHGVALAARLALKFARDGRLPNWDEVELGN